MTVIRKIELEHADCITDTNVLMVRQAFLGLETDGKCIFDLFELLAVAVLVLNRESMNTLDADDDYI